MALAAETPTINKSIIYIMPFSFPHPTTLHKPLIYIIFIKIGDVAWDNYTSHHLQGRVLLNTLLLYAY